MGPRARCAATNTGNVSLTGVKITDTYFTGHGTLSALACTRTVSLTVLPGLSLVCRATHTVTQADVDAGVVSNTANAAGTAPNGQTVTAPPRTLSIPVPGLPPTGQPLPMLWAIGPLLLATGTSLVAFERLIRRLWA
jgi:hypothetical protein